MFLLSCPSCGAPVKFATQTTGYAVCDACQSMLVRRDLDIEKIGVTAAVQEDGTPLQIGANGKHGDRSFDIVGRIQVRYPFGFWNEWYVLFGDGRDGWIGEAQGTYFVCERVDAPALPPFEGLGRGTPLQIDGTPMVVTDARTARVVGCQGALPFVQQSGYDAPLVDLRSASNKGATIDYSEEPPLLFVGAFVDFDDLGFTNLRELEGW